MIEVFSGHSTHSMDNAARNALLKYDDWRVKNVHAVAQLISTAIAVVPGDGQNGYWYMMTMVIIPMERIGRGN